MTTGAILAGGGSTRMGFNKAFIRINGQTIIERTVDIFKKEFDEVFIAANDILLYENLSVKVVADIIKGGGSLAGVHAALFHSSSEYTFITACDMPFIDAAAIRLMKKALDRSDAIVPFIDGRYHPMHAFYSKRCLKPAEAMIKEGNLRITDLFARIKTRKLDAGFFRDIPVRRSIENVNTREDLLRTGGADQEK